MKKLVWIFLLVFLLGCEPTSPPLFSLGDVVTVKDASAIAEEEDSTLTNRQVCIIVEVMSSDTQWRYKLLVRDKTICVNESELNLVERFDWNQEF